MRTKADYLRQFIQRCDGACDAVLRELRKEYSQWCDLNNMPHVSAETNLQLLEKPIMKRAFWYHYNKPASRSAGQPRLTVHHSGKCHIVSEIVCNVPTQTRVRKTQPMCVIAGKGHLHITEDGVAVIS